MEIPSVLDALPRLRDVLGPAFGRNQVLALPGGFSAHVIPRPGDTLTRTAHSRIYSALVPVTTRSFCADMTSYWAQRSREGYLERLAEFVLIADERDTMVGWTGFHVLPYDDVTLVYLDSTGMILECQSRGVMRGLMHDRVHTAVLPACPANRPVYLTARTESPVFYRLMRSLLAADELHPHPADPIPDDVVECVVLLAGWLGQGHLLDPATLIVRGAYDAVEELYGELPTAGDPELDALFGGRLGPLDAYLLAGRAR